MSSIAILYIIQEPYNQDISRILYAASYLTISEGYFDLHRINIVTWTLEIEILFYVIIALTYKKRLLKVQNMH